VRLPSAISEARTHGVLDISKLDRHHSPCKRRFLSMFGASIAVLAQGAGCRERVPAACEEYSRGVPQIAINTWIQRKLCKRRPTCHIPGGSQVACARRSPGADVHYLCPADVQYSRLWALLPEGLHGDDHVR